MRKILSASLMLAALFHCTISQAQTQTQTPDQAQPQNQVQPQDQMQPQAQAQPQPQPQSQTQMPPAVTAENKAPLDERFNKCLNDKDCSTQARLQIIQEEQDAMNDHFQKVHQACADANFQNCIDKQKDDVQSWYSAQNNMQQMMRSMGAEDVNAKEPSAGNVTQPANESKWTAFWHKIWPSDDNNK